MSPSEFRALFPALGEYVWLDTPGLPPACAPVTAAVRSALDEWDAGRADWRDWAATAATTGEQFASVCGLSGWPVAAVGSTAEAASSVARSLRGGRVVVLEDEFMSNLLPWTQLARAEVVARSESRTTDLLEAIVPGVELVAVSHVTSLDGELVDLAALRAATTSVGAMLFVNVTQSIGVLDPSLSEVQPDFVAAHGYKWLLAPRGAAWLAVRPDRADLVRPAAPSWTSDPLGRTYFGAGSGVTHGVEVSGGSPAWFSSIGARSALAVIDRIDHRASDLHVRALAARFRAGAIERGHNPLGAGGSHIEVLRLRCAERVGRALRARKVRSLINGDRLRVGFHYFVTDADLDLALGALD